MLIEGGNTKTQACALSTVTGIPLIRLHGDSRSYEQCEKAIQMSAGYRDYGHAALEILNTFGWKTIALVFDGKYLFLLISYNIILHILFILHPSIHPSIYLSFNFVCLCFRGKFPRSGLFSRHIPKLRARCGSSAAD